ncbi:MAG: hypothetical protein WBA09_07575 [Candidatus Acidiferrum sp.]
MSAGIDPATLARKDLIEKTIVLAFHWDNLLADARLRSSSHPIGASPRYPNQTFGFPLQRHRAGATSMLQIECPQSAFPSKITNPLNAHTRFLSVVIS